MLFGKYIFIIVTAVLQKKKFNLIKMPPNSVVKTSLIVGGLTFLGFIAGGRLGSMFGKILQFNTIKLFTFCLYNKVSYTCIDL